MLWEVLLMGVPVFGKSKVLSSNLRCGPAGITSPAKSVCCLLLIQLITGLAYIYACMYIHIFLSSSQKTAFFWGISLQCCVVFAVEHSFFFAEKSLFSLLSLVTVFSRVEKEGGKLFPRWGNSRWVAFKDKSRSYMLEVFCQTDRMYGGLTGSVWIGLPIHVGSKVEMLKPVLACKYWPMMICNLVTLWFNIVCCIFLHWNVDVSEISFHH